MTSTATPADEPQPEPAPEEQPHAIPIPPLIPIERKPYDPMESS